MHHFFADKNYIDNEFITIKGSDVNHIKNVLRMRKGDELLISDGEDKDYYCKIDELSDEEIKAKILEIDKGGNELDTEFYLFQCLPKGDKMELIIQKAVELGVKEIIPVSSKRAIVKLDDKKAEAKVKRWNSISESAAKQSGRIIIPQVKKPISFREAVKYAEAMDMAVIPYENFKDMTETRQVIDKMQSGMRIGIFIGPEGGFDGNEIEMAVEAGIERISLGRRILRTETAGMTILSILMFKMER